MTMRMTTPTALTTLSARATGPDRSARSGRPGGTSRGARGRRRKSLLQRVDAYTRWAFNPQQELTSRYDRAA